MKALKWVLVAALIAGCTQTKKPQTMHEQSTTEWNHARAAIYYSLAKQQYESTEFDKSRQSVDQAITLEPKNVPALLLSAKLFIEGNQLEAAERQLDQVRATDVKNAEADYLSGIVYQRWQMPALALTHYISACDKAPAELAYVMARAEMQVTLDRTSEALELLQSKVQYFDHSAAIRDAIGQLLVDQGKYAAAVDMFRQAALLADGDNSIHERLGLAMYYARQYHDAADTLGLLTSSPSYAKRADILLALGDAQMHLERWHDALNSFQAASEADPSSETWLKTAEAAMQLGDLHWSLISINKALAIDSTNSKAEIMLGYLRLKENRLADSLSAFIAANRLDPKDSLSVTMTGYVYEKRGMKKEAVECYNRALVLHPGDELAVQLLQKING
ncbi:MAG TPA: tetratricopeptide repeat protein [Tepidisphaeraceae bacterium]|jgi:tetratricopeptide (TPR) repeat protein